jgi:putative phosphoesterase
MRLPPRDEYHLGVVSDTHGLVRPEAVRDLQGVDLIVHAGDIGGIHVFRALEAIAPVVAVRGNVDLDQWAGRLPQTAVIEVGPVLLYLLHDLGALDLDPAAAGISAVISGHSHQPAVARGRAVSACRCPWLGCGCCRADFSSRESSLSIPTERIDPFRFRPPPMIFLLG